MKKLVILGMVAATLATATVFADDMQNNQPGSTTATTPANGTSGSSMNSTDPMSNQSMSTSGTQTNQPASGATTNTNQTQSY